MADARVDSPLSPDTARARAGFAYGASAYLLWGFVALYFDWLGRRGVDAANILAYRITWSTVFIGILVTALGLWPEVRACLRTRRSVLALLASTVLIGVNWWVYIYSVATHQLSYASLGYYMNPLVNVLLGVAILGERLRKLQIAAVLLAAGGVAFQTVVLGKLPWISLSLAVSFGMYGLMRKVMPAGALAGLMVETALLTPLTLSFIGYQAVTGAGPDISPSTHGLLALSGVVTATPLLLFAAGARRLRLTTMGFLQFFSPTLQLLIAVTVFGEPFTPARAITFACIWAAVAVFLLDQVLAARRALPQPPLADMET